MKAFRWSLLFGIALLIASLIEFSGDGLLLAVAVDLSHVPLFGALAILLFSAFLEISDTVRPWASAVWAAAVAATFAAVVELAQLAVARDASLADWMRGCVGIVAFLALYITLGQSSSTIATRSGRMRAAIVFGAVAVLVPIISPLVDLTLAHRYRSEAFPVLFDGDRRWSALFVRANNAEFSRARAPYESGRKGGVGRLVVKPGHFARLVFLEPSPDWRGYEQLVIWAYLDSRVGRQMMLRIEDVLHNDSTEDRYQAELNLVPGPNRVSISLEDVRRAPASRLLEIGNIERMVLYDRAPVSSYVLYLEKITLM